MGKIELGFEVVRNRVSVTQGSATVYLNGEEMVTFNDEPKLIDGEWKSTKTDNDFVMAAMYHPYDHVYHHSDKIKEQIKNFEVPEKVSAGIENVQRLIEAAQDEITDLVNNDPDYHSSSYLTRCSDHLENATTILSDYSVMKEKAVVGGKMPEKATSLSEESKNARGASQALGDGKDTPNRDVER